MRIGYISADPIQGDWMTKRHGVRFYEIIVKQNRVQKVVRGTVVIEDETVVIIKRAGFPKPVEKGDDILRVYGILVSYIMKAKELTIETNRYSYTLRSVYDTGYYVPLKS